MNGQQHGQLRRSQVITTFGPGALIDLPNDSAIVGGLDTWGSETSLGRIDEPRLSAKLTSMTGVPHPSLYAPPPEPDHWQDKQRGIGAWRFPEWFVVQDPGYGAGSTSRSRRMVRRTALDRGKPLSHRERVAEGRVRAPERPPAPAIPCCCAWRRAHTTRPPSRGSGCVFGDQVLIFISSSMIFSSGRGVQSRLRAAP